MQAHRSGLTSDSNKILDRSTDCDHDAEESAEPDSNRRGFLRLAGAAAVGATAAVVVGSSQPAAAATDGFVVIGRQNSSSTLNDTTQLTSISLTALDDQTFRVDNYSDNPVTLPVNHRIAVAATVAGKDGLATDTTRTAVYGRTAPPSTLGGQGVFGSTGGPDNEFAAVSSFGVVGTGGVGGYGVFGYCDKESPTATGVLGRADAGYGVVAASVTGVSLLVRNGGRLQQSLRTAAGAPSVGAFTIGEMIRDVGGDMYICTVTGTPGTWRKVTAQHPEYANAGGSINLLARPIRLIDSRGTAGVPINNGSVRFSPGVPLVAQITGTVADGLQVPAGARGILGNLTATGATGDGFALVWANGQPQPATSNMNYSLASANPAIANYFISAIDSTGKMKVQCAGNATHLLVDVFGFVF